MNFDNIPQELKDLKQWVCHTPDKLPMNAKTGKNAQSNNPATWSDYETAIKGMEKFKFEGIGFMFANGYFGVDLDHCINNTDFIEEFVETLDSYAEISKSGEGIHIICKGMLPQGKRRKDNVEMYDSGRYFCMTGNNWGIAEIKDCTETIKILHNKYLSEPKPMMMGRNVQKIYMSDDDVISKARLSKNGMYFEALYRGNWQGAYTSQSEADLAFCNMLAFWTQKESEQIDRIFRSSGLFRTKWDSLRSGVTYGNSTISKAVQGCTEVYGVEMQGKEQDLVVGVFGKKTKVPKKNYEPTDTGNANRLSDKYRGQLKFSYQNKMWYYWTGKVWQEDLTGESKKMADEVIIDMKKDAFDIEDEEKREMALKWVARTSNSKSKENMLKESQHLTDIPVLSSEFDTYHDYLNCQNGVVNLRNGELIPHNSVYMQSKISLAEYSKDKEPTQWLKFLDDVTGGDKELQLFLQKAVGYSLTGSTKEQCVFFLYGSGNNGKSTFLDIITDLAGSYSCNVQPETVMVKNPMQSGGANTDIARLRGSRFVTTIEPNESVKINEGLLKQLTGGDKVTARFLYGREFEFMPEFKLWLGTNHKPIIRGTDIGIWRRIRMIPFTVNIPKDKVDKNLKFKLRKELPYILDWAVQGCLLWQKEGLELPASVQKATEEYKSEMDLLGRFCDDCVELNYLSREKASDLYEVYIGWAKENNEYEMSSTKFSKELAKKYPEKVRMADGVFFKNTKISTLGMRFKTKDHYHEYKQYKARHNGD